MSNSFFQRATHIVYCDYCMYHKWNENNTDIPAFEYHRITARHCRRYLHTIEYCEAQSQINAAKRTRRLKTNKGDQNACIKTLTLFARSKWPRGRHETMFSKLLMQQIATAAGRIKFIKDFCNKLAHTYNLANCSLRLHASDIVSILQTTISSNKQDLQPIEGQNT